MSVKLKIVPDANYMFVGKNKAKVLINRDGTTAV